MDKYGPVFVCDAVVLTPEIGCNAASISGSPKLGCAGVAVIEIMIPEKAFAAPRAQIEEALQRFRE